ncbi:hypothetical protein [Thioclava sp. DLFJ4-1]|uniref:hypothetical protein n=1 Tax=Thioclava sp. DLFJ4-1 TaxID=1915313 RepID=UPI000998C929|nr:hypothetical protein [Thioclava sp. DLFJ4-1]OOY16739.1 hypothetical protein BMI85_06650 [Thioclava sp. DLFJ4-1]
MEQLITEIEVYARHAGMKPQAVLRAAINAKWSSWAGWVAGTSSPTMANADRIRAWMRMNPPGESTNRKKAS